MVADTSYIVPGNVIAICELVGIACVGFMVTWYVVKVSMTVEVTADIKS